MKYKHVMSCTAIVLLLLGFSFLLSSRWRLSFFGIDLNEPAEPRLFIRSGPDPLLVGAAFMCVLGAMLIGLGILAWLVRCVGDVGAQGSLTSGFFVLTSLALLSVFLQHVQVWSVLPQLRGTSTKS